MAVWDLPVRLFHWLLVAAVGVSWASGELGWMRIHFVTGYFILTLLLFRVAWGFVGSKSARFSDFLKGPAAAFEHLRELRSSGKHAHPVLGHNPLGGWMVAALLLILAVQVGSGLFTSDDILVDGPLVAHAGSAVVKLLSTVHRLAFNLILAMVAVHIVVIVAYLLLRGENLVRPMLTGRKIVPGGITVEPPRQAGLLPAALIAFMAAALVVTLVTAA
ncbi:cytochrome b/b6 domain-containing protein [Skermanella mucosa]|uniref:cytochrome b/b6 domain-containing protein n=1 Tax=Skermanella mucosa TaxID=1789672 RepID=UPI00192C8372|nr:cytochrome b/b6 domain-containing protein [Skermanella mucosa]UEM23317.1 cytochrome b/b6 domain-containing protein [Skermanella mucosa]